MAERLSAADRWQVLDALEQITDELAQISSWLTGMDEDRAAIELEAAWQATAAAGWVLDRPVRTKPVGWLTAADGQHDDPAMNRS